MTLYSFSSTDAHRNMRRNRASLWPDGRRKNETRLQGLATVLPSPSFTLDKSDKLMTIGSCFAREIEKFLVDLDFDLPPLDVVIPTEERVSTTENDILNKYTVHSMENEIRWGFSDIDIPPEDFYLRASEDTWHDGQLVHNLIPASLDRVIERRQQVSTMMSRLPECRVTIITLGLVEAWYDTKTDLYLNGIPPNYAMREEPDRFELRVLDFEDITTSLERIYELHQAHGHPDFKILITVSPVPFKATLSGRDAIVANTYGKSVQRAAAEVFSARHDNVDYFPSYEIVTLSGRALAYEADNIHVTRPAVQHIMAMVLNAYAPGSNNEAPAPQGKPVSPASPPKTQAITQATPANMMATATYSMKDRDYADAITTLTSMLYRFEHKLTSERAANAHLTLGIAMLHTKQTAAGVKHLQKAKELTPDAPHITYNLGLGLARLGQQEQALGMFREAVAQNSASADYHWRLGVQLCRLEKQEEGLEQLREALTLAPDHKAAQESLATYG